MDRTELVPITDSDLELAIAEAEIRRVLYAYCRGVDRRDYALVRSCYDDRATDDHGKYRGPVDGFITFLQTELDRFTRTMHFVGNVIVDVTGDTAWSEAYTIAFHRLVPAVGNQESDYICGLRYLDRHTRRDGKWRIAERRCIYEWSRVDPVETGSTFPDGFAMGQSFPNDIVYATPRGDN
jgi:SnoaL-like domain